MTLLACLGIWQSARRNLLIKLDVLSEKHETVFLIDSYYLFGTIHWVIPEKANNGVERHPVSRGIKKKDVECPGIS